MKKSFVAFLSIAGLLLVTVSSAFATATVSNLTSVTISADTAGGSYTTLAGPILTEGANRDIGTGAIVLSAPSGFAYNPAVTVSVTVTRVSGTTGTLVTLSSGAATVATNSITITVSAQDQFASTARSILTWSGIQVRPTAGTPLSTNNITKASGGATITGITSGSTSFGTLTETVGAATKLVYTTAPAATNTAGSAMTSVVVQVQDQFGNKVSTNNVAITVALNTGAFASGTTTVNTGAGGSATFNNLVIDAAGSSTLTASAAATTFTATPASAFTIVSAAASTIQFLQDAPSTVVAGMTFSPPVTVQIADAFSNPISNKTVTLSLNGGGSLNGTTSQASDGTGVATFSGLSVNQAGSKSLTASITSPSLSVTGGTFTVNSGPAAALGYTIAPAATTTAGVTMATIVVQVQDSLGNSIASNGVPIAVTLNTGAFTSGTTTVNTAPDGSATFSDLLINTAGHYALTASAIGTGLLPTSAAAFTILDAPISTIAITQDAPASVTAGATFSPAVTVQVADSFSNPITNKTVTLTLNGGGSLSGTVARATAVNGVATFNNLSISLAGTNYSLTAGITSPSLSVTGGTFVVTTAAATKLVYTTGPVATNTAGVTMPTFVVQVEDQFGNFIPTNGVPIAMALNTGTFAGGTTPVNTAPDGSATFSDLVITNAGNNTLTATDGVLTPAASALTILPATFAITFQQDAPSPATAGVTFAPPVAVRIADPFNNVLTNKTVTLSLNGGGSLSGTVAQATAATGVATFNNLSISVAGTNYSLTAAITSPSLSVTGSTFVVNTAAATKLVYTTVPVTTNTAGQTLPAFVVQIEDQFNNSIATNGVLITMSLSSGTFASGTPTNNTAADGSASFGDLVITNAANNTLTASATGLTSTNKTLVILPAAFAITFQQDAPSPATAGLTFAPLVAVRIADPFNNVLSNRTVTLSLLGGGTLNGTLSRTTTNNGVATFTNLTINVVGTNYSLVANSTNSLSVTGATFAVNAASASKLVYTTVPVTTNTAGQTLPAFVVQIEDQFNNSILTNGVPIAMTLSNGTFASGTTPVNTAVDGSATFNDLVITNSGNNILTASSAGLASTNKTLVILTTGTNSINFIQAPAPSITAGSVFTNTVMLADLFNNGITNVPVTLTLIGGGSLNGTTVRSTAANGVASFTNLNIAVAGTNYAMIASIATPSLSVTSSTFVVTTAAASKLVYTTPPVATNTAGQTLPTFVVQVTDSFNNAIPTNGIPITMTLNTGTFASGTTPVDTAPDGSATFSDLVITNAGNNILTASATGLTSTNKAITILDTAISNIAFIQGAPSVTNAGAVFTPSVTVKVTDTLNNGISNATVTLSLNGGGTLNGTLTHATAGNGVATFNNLSINLPGNAYSLTASTTNSLSVTGNTFAITVGAIHHYVVTAGTPQTRGVAFGVTVTAQDVVSNTVPDSSTVVTMSGSSVNVQFDSNGDSIFGQNVDNTQVLSNGTFTISTEDNIAETITVTATDGTGKTGTSPSILVNAASGDFRSASNGNWNAIATWQTWNGSSWVAASSTPAGGAGTNITIQSIHTVTDNVAVSLTGTLIAQGTASFSAGGSITVGSGGLVQNSGAVTNSSVSTLIFGAGSTYEHNFTTTAGAIPIATWNTNSTCEVIGYTTLDNSGGTPVVGGFNQAFANLTWNCLNQSGTMTAQGSLTTVNGNFTLASSGTGFVRLGNNAAGDLAIAGNYSQTGGHLQITAGANRIMTVAGNFSLSGGTFDLTDGSASGRLNVAGNFSHTGGTLTESQASSPVANVVFDGTGIQAYTSGGTVSGTVNFNVSNNATLFMGTNLLGSGSSGTFTLSTGGTLGIGNALGITTSGASGNVRVSGTRTYSTGANYIYNGPASQVTSNGLPATVSSLTVSNTGGIVTLGSTVSVTSNLTVSAGTLDLGSFTANRATSGGTLTVANAAALKISGTNPFPSNYATRNLGASSTIEYEGSAQNVSALAYGNLTTSGSGIKTLQPGATTIAAELSIGTGTTFAAGTNDFSIAGDWSNNGSFASSGSQTVTFNGTSPQNIDEGTASTTFNNVSINAGSVLNLAFTGSDTALALTIAGVNKAPGTWGATGSGATHIDAHFQGTTGTLNVTTGPTSTTTLSSTINPSTYGQFVTLTATVAVAGGTPPPTGIVTFMTGVNTLGTQALSGSPTGTAAFVASGLLPGSYSITAVYSGDDNFPGSTSGNLSQQVNPAPLTIAANSTTKTYGQTVSFAGTEFTNSALVGDDSVTSVTLTSDGVASNAAAGSHSIIPSFAVGTGLTNYTITYQNGTLTVNQATVIGSITSTNKVYDGTTTATISGYSLSGVLFGDDVSLTGGTANFIDRNVGNNKSVTATGLSLGGTMAGNYVLAFSSASTTASITPATLTVSADNKSRPFGQPNPTLTASYTGFGAGDGTNVLSGTPDLSTSADTNSAVGGYPINVIIGSLSAANYTFAFTNGTLAVTKAFLTVTADSQSRPYGATNPVFTATFSGFFNGDTTNVVSGVPDFTTSAISNSPVAGNPYTIIPTNGTLIATNYDFAFVNGQLTVTPASVSGNITASNKVYDATTVATISGYSLSGVLFGDDTTLTGGTAAFIDRNVGNNKLVTAIGLVLSGTTTGNYELASSTTNTTANITAYPITVTAATNTKPYDQATSATALPTITSGNLQGTDTTGFSETYSDKNVATGKTLTPSGSVIDGNGGDNYTVTFLPDTTGVINALSLTVNATGVDKVYDGTTNATVTLSDNRLLGDSFTDSYTTASFAEANVGSNKTVSVSGIAIAGTDAGNYTANTTASTTANITAGSLTISADNKSKTEGLPNPPLTASYAGFVVGDDTNSLTTQVSLTTTATTNSPVGTYPITASGAVAPNYTISYNSGTLTVVAVPQLTALGISANQFIFSFPTISNQLYQVEYKDDMSAPTWTLLGSPLPGTGGSITITNAITGQNRFFQVDITPGQ